MFNGNKPSLQAKTNADAVRSGENQISLLIIEDALIHSTIIGHIAEKVGFTTATARSYEDACEILSARQFDCITLDLGLGDHVGLDVLHYLHATRCRAQIIIISLSDKKVCDEMVQIGKALDLNIDSSVHKPLDLKALRETLEQIRIRAQLQKLTVSPL